MLKMHSFYDKHKLYWDEFAVYVGICPHNDAPLKVASCVSLSTL